MVESTALEMVLRIPDVADGVGRLDLMLNEGEYEVFLEGEQGSRRQTVIVRAREVSRYVIDSEPERRRYGWIWAVAGVVLVGAAVTAAVVVTQSEQPPRSDPVYGTITTLRAP